MRLSHKIFQLCLFFISFQLAVCDNIEIKTKAEQDSFCQWLADDIAKDILKSGTWDDLKSLQLTGEPLSTTYLNFSYAEILSKQLMT